jgi:tetratricopeptide (TPR) repeat protein
MALNAEQSQDRELKARVFISYSRKDMAFADRLDAALKARDFDPLIDRTEIYVFEDWWQRIQNLIIQADTVIFVLSPDSVSSDMCNKELGFAASRNKRFAPIQFRQFDTKMVPSALERFEYEFFDDAEKFEQSVDRLVEALEVDIDWIRNHTMFGRQAHRWSAAGRPRGLLLRSPILEEAERWIASRPRNAPMPTAETQDFIAKSRRATSRGRDILLAGLATGLLLALGLVGLAYWQRGIAQEANVIAQSEAARTRKALATTTQMANTLVIDLGRDPRALSLPSDLLRRIFNRAIQGYDEVIMQDPTNPQTYNNRGNAYFAEGDLDHSAADYDQALANYDRAIVLDPKYALAYSNRCWTHVVLGQHLQQAVLDCTEALRIQPKDARALDNRGFAYLRLGRPDDAIENFDAALEINPKLATSLYGRGLAKLQHGDPKGAQVDMAAANEIQTNVADQLARYDIK